MTKSEKEVPVLVQKADKAWRISAIPVPSLAGNNKKFTMEHKVGRGGALFIDQVKHHLGLKDQYLKKVAELRRKWKTDNDAFNVEDQMWTKHYNSQARDAVKRATLLWKDFYMTQDLEPCATWIPSGDRDKGSVYAIWAMIEISSRKLVVGTDADYAKYLWQIKKLTQKAHDKNDEITRDTREYLKMGHAGKDVAHFLKQVVEGDIPDSPPPGIAYIDKK